MPSTPVEISEEEVGDVLGDDVGREDTTGGGEGEKETLGGCGIVGSGGCGTV